MYLLFSLTSQINDDSSVQNNAIPIPYSVWCELDVSPVFILSSVLRRPFFQSSLIQLINLDGIHVSSIAFRNSKRTNSRQFMQTHLMCVHTIFSSVSVAEWLPFGK